MKRVAMLVFVALTIGVAAGVKDLSAHQVWILWVRDSYLSTATVKWEPVYAAETKEECYAAMEVFLKGVKERGEVEIHGRGYSGPGLSTFLHCFPDTVNPR